MSITGPRVTTSIRIDLGVQTALKVAAVRETRTFSNMVEVACREYLKRQEPEITAVLERLTR